jgi:hypothetical protein
MAEAVSATAELWRERIAAQQAGGQSIRALCKENGWHEHAFYWWRSRLGLSPASVIRRGRPSKMPAGFTEVVVDRPAPAVSWVEPPMASAVEPIRLRLGAGRELVLPVSMADERVASLIRLIEAKPQLLRRRDDPRRCARVAGDSAAGHAAGV